MVKGFTIHQDPGFSKRFSPGDGWENQKKFMFGIDQVKFSEDISRKLP
jgi:hypothetical protein